MIFKNKDIVNFFNVMSDKVNTLNVGVELIGLIIYNLRSAYDIISELNQFNNELVTSDVSEDEIHQQWDAILNKEISKDKFQPINWYLIVDTECAGRTPLKAEEINALMPFIIFE